MLRPPWWNNLRAQCQALGHVGKIMKFLWGTVLFSFDLNYLVYYIPTVTSHWMWPHKKGRDLGQGNSLQLRLPTHSKWYSPNPSFSRHQGLLLQLHHHALREEVSKTFFRAETLYLYFTSSHDKGPYAFHDFLRQAQHVFSLLFEKVWGGMPLHVKPSLSDRNSPCLFLNIHCPSPRTETSQIA